MRRLPVFASLVVLTACAGGAGAAGGSDRRELTVSAAASLTGAFTEIGAGFEARHDGVTVTFNFGPSDGLATQIHEGAQVDVFAAASGTWMDAVAADPGIRGRADLARNRLAIVVPADDPAGIATLEDLAAPGVKLVLAAEGVPAGDYAREVLALAGVSQAALANLVSNEEDVKAVVTKVLVGDADAGIVYATDVTPEIADRVRLVEIPDDLNVVATYPIAVVSGTREAVLARAFVDHVLGDGQAVLARYGFLPPT